MNDYSLTHLVDAVLLRELASKVAQERTGMAEMLALIGEVDARRLYAPVGYSSMHAFLVKELRFSDDAAFKRIQAARAARRFPALFAAIADGRLHLTGVCLLAPHLNNENLWELMEAAKHRRQPEIEAVLARRFLVPPVSERAIVRAVPPAKEPATVPEVAVPQVDWLTVESPVDSNEDEEATSKEDDEAAPSSAATLPSFQPPSPAAAQSTERYLVKLMITKSVYEKLCRAQALLSHSVPSRDLAEVLDRALRALIEEIEKRRFGSSRGRRPPH